MRATSQHLRTIALKWAADRGINPLTEFQPHPKRNGPTMVLDAGHAIRIDPVPMRMVRVKGTHGNAGSLVDGRTWLWLPAEVLTSHAAKLHKETSMDIRVSNIWYWVRGQRHKCDHATGYNEKWRWTLREHGLKPWCDPALPIRKVDELQCQFSDGILYATDTTESKPESSTDDQSENGSSPVLVLRLHNL